MKKSDLILALYIFTTPIVLAPLALLSIIAYGSAHPSPPAEKVDFSKIPISQCKIVDVLSEANHTFKIDCSPKAK